MFKERLSPSLGGKLLQFPIEKVIYDIENPKPAGDAYHRGNRWEKMLFNPNQILHIFEGTKTSGVKFDKWAADIDAPDYMKVTQQEADETYAFLVASEKYPELLKVIRESEYQIHLESETDHCFTDFINESEKTIIEMKVMTEAHKFNDQLFRYNYDLQCYMQLMLSDFKYEFQWLTIDSSAPYLFTLWNTTPELIESGRQKYLQATTLFEQMNNWEGSKLEIKCVEVPTWRINQCL